MSARLDNRPLLGTIDAELFLSPPIMSALERAINRGLNALVLGPHGSGKTTLLRHLQAERQDDAQPAVYVDLGPAGNETDALDLITDALGRRWSAFGDQLRSNAPPETTPSGALLRLARRVGEAPASLLLIDSPPGHGHAHVLFGRLRDELWQQGHKWVVAADEMLRDELTRPPASAFFDVRLELSALSEEQQRKFLSLRLAKEQGFVDIESIVGKTDGLPRSVLTLAREAVLSSRPVDVLLAEREHQRKRLQSLPPTASAIMSYLAEHGPTSGSDPSLLATLGVSGQRARMVLRELEQAQLVRSFPEQQRHQGRPRKLYEPTDTVS